MWSHQAQNPCTWRGHINAKIHPVHAASNPIWPEREIEIEIQIARCMKQPYHTASLRLQMMVLQFSQKKRPHKTKENIRRVLLAWSIFFNASCLHFQQDKSNPLKSKINFIEALCSYIIYCVLYLVYSKIFCRPIVLLEPGWRKVWTGIYFCIWKIYSEWEAFESLFE